MAAPTEVSYNQAKAWFNKGGKVNIRDYQAGKSIVISKADLMESFPGLKASEIDFAYSPAKTYKNPVFILIEE